MHVHPFTLTDVKCLTQALQIVLVLILDIHVMNNWERSKWSIQHVIFGNLIQE